MALHYITEPGFTYQSAAGFPVFVDPAYGPYAALNVFDTADPRRSCQDPFVPPVTGVLPMDAEAKAALDAVRAPFAGKQTPGVGYFPDPVDTPIWSP